MENMEKVVKCHTCGQYFMLTEKAIKCPFCYTIYNEVEEKASAQGGSQPKADQPLAGAITSGGKDEKGTAKTQKNSFKVWKNN